MLTRLHVRYSAATFPEDLTFQETEDQANFQGRYVLRHLWAGSEDTCLAAKSYFDDLRQRRTTEAATLADLTGWNIDEIYQKAGYDQCPSPPSGGIICGDEVIPLPIFPEVHIS